MKETIKAQNIVGKVCDSLKIDFFSEKGAMLLYLVHSLCDELNKLHDENAKLRVRVGQIEKRLSKFKWGPRENKEGSNEKN